jgi:hypothetical protein
LVRTPDTWTSRELRKLPSSDIKKHATTPLEINEYSGK